MLATQSIKAWAQQKGYIQACTIELSINKDLKLRKRKKKDKQHHLKFYTIFTLHDHNLRQSVAICQYHNKYIIKSIGKTLYKDKQIKRVRGCQPKVLIKRCQIQP